MFYIESRYIDIKTLINLPDYTDGDDYSLPPNIPQKTNADKVDFLEIFEVKEEKTEQNQPPDKNTESLDLLFSIIAPRSLKTDSPDKPLDKMSFYIKFINENFTGTMSADLIRILLNPYNSNLIYRYESQDIGRMLPAISRQINEKSEDINSITNDENENEQKPQFKTRNNRELIESDHKKKLENKLAEAFRLQKRQLLEKRIINNVRG